MLEADNCSKDLATVRMLKRKHLLLQTDIHAHEERMQDLNKLTDFFRESGVWEENGIGDKVDKINDR